jgi:hypothetical protein
MTGRSLSARSVGRCMAVEAADQLDAEAEDFGYSDAFG